MNLLAQLVKNYWIIASRTGCNNCKKRTILQKKKKTIKI